MTIYRGKGVYEPSITQTDEIWSLEEKDKLLFAEEKTFHKNQDKKIYPRMEQSNGCTNYFPVTPVINAVSVFYKWIPMH